MTKPSFFQRAFRRVDKTLSSFFFLDQWVILTAKGADYDSLDWSAFHPLIPEKDRYWGDPFIIKRENQYYIFVEEKLYATGLGRIVCLTLDEQGNLYSHPVVLERPYHLSYPFIFDFQGELYMLPETASQRTLEIYRCTHFPDEWTLVKTLMTDIYAVDATLLEHQDNWWLFANVKGPGGSSLDALHLFYAKNPLTEKWTPHPRNPIVRDIRSARPAGRIFMQDGKLIRPSQDSSRRYGYAITFNRILKLSEHEYEEAAENIFAPRGGDMLATHTFNQAGDMTVLDAVIRRRK
jgi:hypothetical protein